MDNVFVVFYFRLAVHPKKNRRENYFLIVFLLVDIQFGPHTTNTAVYIEPFQMLSSILILASFEAIASSCKAAAESAASAAAAAAAAADAAAAAAFRHFDTSQFSAFLNGFARRTEHRTGKYNRELTEPDSEPDHASFPVHRCGIPGTGPS